MIVKSEVLFRADRFRSLNAVQLGRLRMSVDECIDSYPRMAENVFGRSRLSFRGVWRSRFSADKLKTEIENIVQLKLPLVTNDEQIDTPIDERFKRFPSPDDLCKT